MIRKALLVALAACLTLVLLPATSALAVTVKGRVVACYGIKKAGTYNGVRVVAQGEISGAYVRGYANLSVSPECQRTNGIPVTRLHIYRTQLRTVNQTVLEQSSSTSTGTNVHKLIWRATVYRHTYCNSVLRVYEEVSYKYSDGSYVNPFWIHSTAFARGC